MRSAPHPAINARNGLLVSLPPARGHDRSGFDASGAPLFHKSATCFHNLASARRAEERLRAQEPWVAECARAIRSSCNSPPNAAAPHKPTASGRRELAWNRLPILEAAA